MANRITLPLPILDVANWREAVLRTVLRALTLFVVVVGLPSLVRSLRTGQDALALLEVVIVALCAVVFIARRRPFLLRATLLCGAVYLIGCALLLRVGAISQLYLMVFSLLCTLLLGVRAGGVASIVSGITLFVIGVFGPVPTGGAVFPAVAYSTAGWAILAINCVVITLVIVGAVGVVLATLERALIAERNMAASLLRETTMLRTFFDNAPDAVFTKDARGRFELANPATVAAHGLSTEQELRGRTVYDVSFQKPLADLLHADDMLVIAANSVVNREAMRVDASGREQWHQIMKAPLHNSAGVVTGLIGVSRDITDRKNLEAQLRQSHKMEAVGQLAGGIAHDFNNLLTVILGYGSMLRAQPLVTPQITECIAAISDAADRAAGLTNQLLAFSRKSALQPVTVNVNTTITDTARLLRRLLGDQIHVRLTLSDALSPVYLDPVQFDQVLMNLAINARDAMPEGGVLTFQTENVEIAEPEASALDTAPGHYVRVTVRDTGVGMSREVAARIFEPFFTTKRVGSGTGLGLAMVFGIVRQSGGAIRVDSEEGAGASFQLCFPAQDLPLGEPVRQLQQQARL